LLGISILSVIILLGVLIFAHELGHFLMAKQAGVAVERFQLGFGPKILVKPGARRNTGCRSYPWEVW